jgi:hypothetical protein
VDDEYELQMQRALAVLGRFEVTRIRYERSDLVEMYRVGGMSSLDSHDSRSKLRAIASANDVDGILVFSRRESRDFLAGTNQLLGGAGFYTNGATGRDRVSVLHLIGTVALVDGKTGNRVATHVLARSQQGRPATVTRSAPMLIVPPELTRLKLSELGDARLADIRRWLVALPIDSWRPTIRALFEDGAD